MSDEVFKMKYKDYISIEASLHSIEMECLKNMSGKDMALIYKAIAHIQALCFLDVDT